MGVRPSSHSVDSNSENSPSTLANSQTSMASGKQRQSNSIDRGATATSTAAAPQSRGFYQLLSADRTAGLHKTPKPALRQAHSVQHPSSNEVRSAQRPSSNGVHRSNSSNSTTTRSYKLRHAPMPGGSQQTYIPTAQRTYTPPAQRKSSDHIDRGYNSSSKNDVDIRRGRSYSSNSMTANGNGEIAINRSRSVSPGRRRSSRQYYHQLKPAASSTDLENFKNAVRSYQKARKSSLSSSQRPGEMTSFVIGRPATFNHPGDLGVFKTISQVNDHLFICGAMALSEEKVRALKINCIINATLEWPPLKMPGLETVRVQVDDVPTASLSPYFDRVADKIHDVACKGGRVLVHCMAGVSRSSTLCIAYLMKHKGLSLSQALSLMRSRRNIIRPNDGFWRQLVQYEKQLKKNKIKPNDSAPSLQRESSKTTLRKVSSTLREQPAQVLVRLPTHIDNSSKSSRASTNPISSTIRLNGSTPSAKHDYSTRTLSRKPSPLSSPSTMPSRATIYNTITGGRSYPSVQREIALSAGRGLSNWTTTYGNSFNRHNSKM